MTILRPDIPSSFTSADNGKVFDGTIANMKFTIETSTPKKLTLDWDTEKVEDWHCEDETCTSAVIDSKPDPGMNQFTSVDMATDAGKGCIEVWTVGINDKMCTRVNFSFKRTFAADMTTTEYQDVPITLRTYKIATGWAFASVAEAPWKQDFTSKEVDFYDGFMGTIPIWNGAFSSIAAAGSVLAASATLLSF